MSLSVGIVGLPNVGKSTLFNALLKKQQAFAANFPFATIEPNIGVVPVPDNRLTGLSQAVGESEKLEHLPPEVPATVEFVDIAGLIAGAHKGEGLGNKFLAHIREVDAILHVVRDFSAADIVKEGSVDPLSDFATIETELAMADFETLAKQKEIRGSGDRVEAVRWQAVTKLRQALEKGTPARYVQLTEDEKKTAKQLSLLTSKPILIALNIDETELAHIKKKEKQFADGLGINQDQVIAVSAKLEEQLAGLTKDEQEEYLRDLGVQTTGLERIIQKAFATLGLITFLTAGAKEVRAWTIKSGTNAKEAASVIHTDFYDKFIKADVIAYSEFIKHCGWKNAREKGLVRSEGKDYVVKDGDVIEFKVGV